MNIIYRMEWKKRLVHENSSFQIIALFILQTLTKAEQWNIQILFTKLINELVRMTYYRELTV